MTKDFYSAIKVLCKGNKVYGESEMEAFDWWHNLPQPRCPFQDNYFPNC